MSQNGPNNPQPNCEDLRLEVVTCCVGFQDLLEQTIALNMPQVDNYIVVTSHDDWRTKEVATKYGAMVVPTDLFKKNGRSFNKGAAINAGFSYFQYQGWRLHLDADIALPCNFRRILFNHTHLEKDCIYGADRFDVVGKDNINNLRRVWTEEPQHRLRFLVDPTHDRHGSIGAFGGRIAGQLEGYAPLGFFQLWNHKTQKSYPYSRGNAAHDDLMFSRLYPESKRRHLPTVCVYHLCPRPPQWGENWDGNRKMPMLNEPTKGNK